MIRWLEKKAPVDLLTAFEKAGIDIHKGDNAEAVVEALGRRALKGGVQEARVFLEQTEIPLPKTLEHSGPDGGPIEVTSNAKERLAELVERRKRGEGDETQ